eukprot:scaffold12824_cov26-Tisochrysis_lutea.AAC.5
MGSEGYLINQFLVSRTNKRTDEWGGSFSNRMRLPVEIVRAHVDGALACAAPNAGSEPLHENPSLPLHVCLGKKMPRGRA